MIRRIDLLLGKGLRAIKKNSRKISVVLVIVLVFAMVFKGLMQIPQILENREYAKYLEDSIEYENKRQLEIDELKDKVDTDEYIEKIASDKLGLVKNNAKIFIDVSE